MRRKLLKFIVTAASLSSLFLGSAAAQSYPTRPIVVVNPYAAGTTTDIVGRLFLDLASKQLGQPMVTETKPGGASVIGTRAMLAAPADGYTLLIQGTSMATISLTDSNAGFRMDDFLPLVMMGGVSLTLGVPADFPPKSLSEFVNYVKANPGKFNYGSLGHTSMAKLSADRFISIAGLNLASIEYKGAPDGLRDLVGGQLQMFLHTTPLLAPQVKSGRIRALAVASEQRSALLPDAPTFRELGIPDMASQAWFGIFARASTPAPVVAMLRKVMYDVAISPEYREKAVKLGIEPLAIPADRLDDFIKKDLALWEKDVQRAGLGRK